MTGSVKYESITEGLDSLEKTVRGAIGNISRLHQKIESLEKKNSELNSTISNLNVKIIELEANTETLLQEKEQLAKSSVFSESERENLKLQINDLVNRIDSHLGS